MKKVVRAVALLCAVVTSVFFTSCKKDGDFAKPMSKNIVTPNTDGFSVLYSYNPGGSLKAFGDSISGIIIEGDTVKMGSTGNLILTTTPVTKCNWVLDGDTIAKNVDQALLSLKTKKVYSVSVINASNAKQKVNFKVDVASAPVVIPPLPGISKLLRLISIEQGSTTSLLTWRASRQKTLSTTYTYLSNWTSWTTGTAFYNSTILSTDSIEFSFMIDNSGLASVRKSFMLMQSNGTWLVADSTACPFYDPLFDSNHDGTPDNVFSFYYDGTNAHVYDANKSLVVPQAAPIAAPGKLGDATNAVNTAEVTGGNLIIYVKMPAGSTVVFQSSATAATAPTAAWTSYLSTTAVPGTTFWSSVTVLATDLNKYNWWIYGTGTGVTYKSDANMSQSAFWIPAAGACGVSLLK
ncbi:MAG: hypothetical protein WCK37_03515 [Candidatus Falkowbacteria bacterium]